MTLSRAATLLRMVLGGLVLLVGVGGCSPDVTVASAPSTGIDLVALFPFTPERPRTERIDFGRPEDARWLPSGWTTIVDSAGAAGRRNARANTTIEFDAGPTPGATRITLRAHVLVPESRRSRPSGHFRSARAQLNGEPLGRVVTFANAPAEYVFDVAASQLRPGRNEIAIKHFGTMDRPRPGPRRDARFVYEWITFAPLTPDAWGPLPSRAGDALVMPAGTTLTFHVRASPGAMLRLGIRPAQQRDALTVAIDVDGQPRRSLRLRASDGGGFEAPLGVAGGRIARLTMQATHALTIESPRILGMKRPPENAPAATTGNAPRPHVILYVVDTLRADAIGTDAAAPSASALGRLSREGIRFTRAVAQSSWTRPATASILTGLDPLRHGATSPERGLAAGVRTLAETLRDAGYDTAAFVTNVNVAAHFGFDRGFERYEYLPERVGTRKVYVEADEVHAAVDTWLKQRTATTPLFLYVHVSDPHAPYTPRTHQQDGDERAHDGRLADVQRPVTADDAARLKRLYDAEIRDIDTAIGDLRRRLEAAGVFDDSVFVLVSDHGEEFGEHGGLGHGRTLHENQLRVPLLVRLPDGRAGGQVVDHLARQIDVMPTILTAAGLAPASPVDGLPLLHATGAVAEATPLETIAGTDLLADGAMALVTERWKVLRDHRTAPLQAYDLTTDPGERRNLAATWPVRTGYAEQRFLEAAARRVPWFADPSGASAVDEATATRLRALGYLTTP